MPMWSMKMIPELVEEYFGDEGREATISIVDKRLSVHMNTYEVLFAMDGEIKGKFVTNWDEYARVAASRWVKKGELTNGVK